MTEDRTEDLLEQEQKELLLRALHAQAESRLVTGDITLCRGCGVSLATFRTTMQHDPEFAAAVHEARQEAQERMYGLYAEKAVFLADNAVGADDLKPLGMLLGIGVKAPRQRVEQISTAPPEKQLASDPLTAEVNSHLNEVDD